MGIINYTSKHERAEYSPVNTVSHLKVFIFYMMCNAINVFYCILWMQLTGVADKNLCCYYYYVITNTWGSAIWGILRGLGRRLWFHDVHICSDDDYTKRHEHTWRGDTALPDPTTDTPARTRLWWRRDDLALHGVLPDYGKSVQRRHESLPLN